MKRILALVLAVMMLVGVLALTACGGETDTTGSPDDPNAPKASITVGAIYIGSQTEPAGYTYAHHKGITDAIKQLEAEGYKVELRIQDNVPEEDAAVTAAIDALVGQGCDLIFGNSFGYLNAMGEAAAKEEYKDIYFSHATGYLSNDTNYNNYFGRIYQARYLAGVAAGLKAKEDGRKTEGLYHIGYVAAYGTEYAETCSGINGFTLGVQSVLGDEAKVFVKTINTWGNPDLEKQAAESLVDTYKCTVIAQHCDSAQPQIVANDKGVFGCGYNSDMTGEAPNGHLVAPIWHWDVYYKLAMETVLKGENFMEKVGIYYGGLKEGFVDVSPITKNCTADTQAKMDAVKALIVSGEWDVFSNVKLSFDAEGKIVKTTAALTTNTGKVVISEDNATYSVLGTDGEATAVEGGAASVDGIIKGSMNYYVAGIEVVN